MVIVDSYVSLLISGLVEDAMGDMFKHQWFGASCRDHIPRLDDVSGTSHLFVFLMSLGCKTTISDRSIYMFFSGAPQSCKHGHRLSRTEDIDQQKRG